MVHRGRFAVVGDARLRPLRKVDNNSSVTHGFDSVFRSSLFVLSPASCWNGTGKNSWQKLFFLLHVRFASRYNWDLYLLVEIGYIVEILSDDSLDRLLRLFGEFYGGTAKVRYGLDRGSDRHLETFVSDVK